MNEAKRIFFQKKFLLTVLLLLFLNLFFFLKEQQEVLETTGLNTSFWEISDDYEKQVEEYRNLSLEEAKEELLQEAAAQEGIWNVHAYNRSRILQKIDELENYPAFLEGIRENYDTYHKVSIFAQESGFSGKNIEKTLKDFSGMDEVSLSLQNDLAADAFFEYDFSNVIVLILVFLLCLQFVQERKKGLWSVIHSAPEGRGSLAIKRIFILLFASVAGTLLTYGVNWCVSVFLYGKGDLSAPIQMMEQFQKVNGCYTIGGFVILSLIFHALGMFLLSLFCWFVFSLIGDVTAAFVVSIVVIVVEYLLYRGISVQSSFVYFKYLNLWGLLDIQNFLGVYQNCSLFGNPVGVKELFAAGSILLFFLLVPLLIFLQKRKYPYSVEPKIISFLKKMFGKLLNLVNYLSFSGFEVYKNLFFQGGIFILVVMIYWAQSGKVTEEFRFYDVTTAYLNSFYEELEEKPLGEAEALIGEKEREVARDYENMEALFADYQNEKITYSEYESKMLAYDNIGQKEEAVTILRERLESLKNYQDKTKIQCQMVNPIGYEELFGEESYRTNRLLAIKLMIFAILFFYLLFTYEKQTKASLIVRATQRGRTGFFVRKMVQVFLYAAVITLLFSGVELYNIAKVYGLPGFFAAAGNLERLQFIARDISICGCFIFLILLRILVLSSIGSIVLFFSIMAKKKEESLLLSAAVLLLPAVFFLIGAELFGYICFVLPLSVTELFGTCDGRIGMIVGSYLVCFIFGIASSIFVKRNWES